MYENTLQHHGVKGMHWGVRRYQNADGSLTSAGKKRVRKVEKYRNKMADKALTKANIAKRREMDARNTVQDLRKNGVNSLAYKEWRTKHEYENRKEFEKNNHITDKKGNVYVKQYDTSMDSFLDSIITAATVHSTINSLIDENNKAAYQRRMEADRWIKSNKRLQNMTVSAATKKLDVYMNYRR